MLTFFYILALILDLFLLSVMGLTLKKSIKRRRIIRIDTSDVLTYMAFFLGLGLNAAIVFLLLLGKL